MRDRRLTELAILMVILSISLVLYSSIASSEEISVVDLLPKDEQFEGWTREGDYIKCEDLDCLMNQIDGAAPFYIDHGAKVILFQDYRHSPSNMWLTLEIYQMESKAQAKTLFADAPIANPTPQEELGDGARKDEKLIGVYLLEFWQDEFFIRITIDSKEDEAKKAVLLFAEFISQLKNNNSLLETN